MNYPHIYLNIAHSGYDIAISCHLSSCPCPHISPLSPLHFYKTPNHPHVYPPNVQTPQSAMPHHPPHTLNTCISLIYFFTLIDFLYSLMQNFHRYLIWFETFDKSTLHLLPLDETLTIWCSAHSRPCRFSAFIAHVSYVNTLWTPFA